MSDVSLSQLRQVVQDEMRMASMPSNEELGRLKKIEKNYNEVNKLFPYSKCTSPNCDELHPNPNYNKGTVHCDDCDHDLPDTFQFCPHCKADEAEDE